jgi:hypothetical protein
VIFPAPATTQKDRPAILIERQMNHNKTIVPFDRLGNNLISREVWNKFVAVETLEKRGDMPRERRRQASVQLNSFHHRLPTSFRLDGVNCL